MGRCGRIMNNGKENKGKGKKKITVRQKAKEKRDNGDTEDISQTVTGHQDSLCPEEQLETEKKRVSIFTELYIRILVRRE